MRLAKGTPVHVHAPLCFNSPPRLAILTVPKRIGVLWCGLFLVWGTGAAAYAQVLPELKIAPTEIYRQVKVIAFSGEETQRWLQQVLRPYAAQWRGLAR